MTIVMRRSPFVGVTGVYFTPIPVSSTGQALTFPLDEGRDFIMVGMHVCIRL